jgi:hypothetical protein
MLTRYSIKAERQITRHTGKYPPRINSKGMNKEGPINAINKNILCDTETSKRGNRG